MPQKLAITKDCSSKFFSNQPTPNASDIHDSVLQALTKHVCANQNRIWNSVELYDLYQQLGETNLSRRSLVDQLRLSLQPVILVLTSPGVSSIVALRSFATVQLRIVDDIEDECNSQASYSLGQKIKDECLDHKPGAHITKNPNFDPISTFSHFHKKS